MIESPGFGRGIIVLLGILHQAALAELDPMGVTVLPVRWRRWAASSM